MIDAIILAAGKGTRMKSDLPKVLHPLAGKPMIDYVLDAVAAVNAHAYVVVGHKAELVRESCSKKTVAFVEQHQQLGTGHAVQHVTPLLTTLPHIETSQVIVLAGDCPLIQPQTLESLFQHHSSSQTKHRETLSCQTHAATIHFPLSLACVCGETKSSHTKSMGL